MKEVNNYHILKSKSPILYKSQLFNSPAWTYDCYTWSLINKIEKKLFATQNAQNSTKRDMLGVQLEKKN